MQLHRWPLISLMSAAPWAVIGLLILPPGTTVGLIAAAVFFGGMVGLGRAGAEDEPRADSWRLGGAVGASGFVFVTASTGIPFVFGDAAAYVVCTLAAVIAVELWWRRRPERVVGADAVDPAELLDASTETLCRRWRASYPALTAATGSAWDRVVTERRLLLDELERRDAEGFSRWLSDGDPVDGDPLPYVGNG